MSVAPVEVEVRKGGNAEFLCSATGLNASSFIYQWFLNDLPVASQTMPTLVINDVTENDTGEYVCFVRNPYGAIGQSAVARLILFGRKSNIWHKIIYLNVLLDQSCPSVTVNYTGFRITWNETLAGVTVEAPCTGDDLSGTIYKCNLSLWYQ